ncbi:hypothetical protein Bca101_055458 [Brassica carinata]
MADTLENMQEAHIRRSEKTESRSIEETNVNKKLDKDLLSVIQTWPDYDLNCDSQGRALGSMVKIMNKNVSVGYYDKTESILISQKKGDEDERQNSTESRPEKRAKTVQDSRERIEDLKKNAVNKDIPENPHLDAQENVPEQIERQRREAQDNLKQQSNQQNMEQQRGVETKGRDVRSRLEQFYNRQRTKKQQFQAQQEEMKHQQEQEPTQQQQQPVSQLVEKLANAVETGTRDQNSDALVTELSSYFNKSQQLLNSLSGSKPMYVDEQKRKLEDSEKLLQQRR